MKSKIYVIAAAASLLLCGCGEKIRVPKASQYVSETDMSVPHTESDTEDTPEALSYSQDEQTPQAWQEAYSEYLNGFWGDSEPYNAAAYSLIYLDDDEIPELFIDTGGEAGGEVVVTFYDGTLHDQYLSRRGTVYIEKSGLLFSNNGHMGYYPVKIMQLTDGQFTVLAEGTHNFRAAEDDDSGYYAIDEDGYPITDYEWEGESVSETEFYEKIDSIFNREGGKRPERWYSMEEMLSVINTGECTSAGHRYELVQADLTWDEAQDLCHEKGGYLATITSPDEQDTIAAQIAGEGMDDISFYVGYRGSEWVEDDFLHSRWINADGSYTEAGCMRGFWEYAAPDYDSKHNEWDYYIKHKCGLIKYYKSENQIYLWGAPGTLLELSPEYTGKMGYICEFDE